PRTDPLLTLGSLIDKSLVGTLVEDGRPRFVLLQTIREYALARLHESEEWEQTKVAHAQHYRDVAEAAGRGLRSRNSGRGCVVWRWSTTTYGPRCPGASNGPTSSPRCGSGGASGSSGGSATSTRAPGGSRPSPPRSGRSRPTSRPRRSPEPDSWASPRATSTGRKALCSRASRSTTRWATR